MGIPTAICIECSSGDNTVEFPSMREMLAHKASGHTIQPPPKVLPPSPEKGPSATEVKATVPPEQVVAVEDPNHIVLVQQPLKLQYKWVGVHAACNTSVKTIEVDVDQWSLLVAYCTNCDEKLAQETVVPIAKQITTNPEDEKIETFEKLMKGGKKK